jgi:aspartyl-tRNA(Asn)/glutamyl-tRNA(Gln) amidotransferase subunit C
MSPTDLASVRALADLARLALPDEQLARHAPELERILAAFRVLGAHALQPGEEPRAAKPGTAREDEPLPSLARAALLAGAPAVEDGFFVVPKTVGGPP